MPEGVGYGPQDTSSIGLNLNIIGNHCYAYSGEVNDNSSGSAASTALDFTTGSYVAQVELFWGDNITDSTAVYLEMLLNGETAFKAKWDDTAAAPTATGGGPFLKMIIAPYTRFQGNFGFGANRNGSLALSGTIYK